MNTGPARPPLHEHPVFWGVLALYAVIELAFNHRLLEVAGTLNGLTLPVQVKDLEFWGRLISGTGLALILMRGLDTRIRSRLLTIVLCLLVGITFMWQFQRWLVDTVVEAADPQDLKMSLYAQLATRDAVEGRLQLRGQPLIDEPVLPQHTYWTTGALFASSVLGLKPGDLQAGNPQLPWLLDQITASPQGPELLHEAYRKAVMVPVAMGLSLCFGLLNLAQLGGLIVAGLLRRLAWDRGRLARLWRWHLPWLVGASLLWTFAHPSRLSASAGYRQVAVPALRSHMPLLSPFVEWTILAEPVWYPATSLAHERLLRGFEFGRSEALRQLI